MTGPVSRCRSRDADLSRLGIVGSLPGGRALRRMREERTEDDPLADFIEWRMERRD